MAYHYEGIAQTQKGKIIYPRKKHSFSAKDLRRLINTVGFPVDYGELYWWMMGIIDLMQFLQKVDQSEIVNQAGWLRESLTTYTSLAENFPGFSGGDFGGAGASRTFWQKLLMPLDVTIPEEE